MLRCISILAYFILDDSKCILYTVYIELPGLSFFREPVGNLLRLHFAREKDTLDEALSRLAKLEEL